jgi:hypothetical protein
MKVSYTRADDVLLLEVSDEGIEYAETTLLRKALTDNFFISAEIKTLTKNNFLQAKP